MPLNPGSSNAASEANVKTEVAAGKPIAQAVAISYSEQRRARRKGSLDQVKKRRRKQAP